MVAAHLSRLAVGDRNSRRWSLGVDSRTGKRTGCGYWELPVGNAGLGCSLGDIGAEGPPTSLAWLPRGGFLYYHDMVAPELWVSARLGQVHAGMEMGCESDLRSGSGGPGSSVGDI